MEHELQAQGYGSFEDKISIPGLFPKLLQRSCFKNSIFIYVQQTTDSCLQHCYRIFQVFWGFSGLVFFNICFKFPLSVSDIFCLHKFTTFSYFHFLQELSLSHLHILPLVIKFHSHPRSTNFCKDQENTQTLQTALSKKIEIYHDKISEVIHVWELRCCSQ